MPQNPQIIALPLIERQVGIGAALEDLQETQCRGAGVFHVVAHGERDIADVSALEIEGSRLAVGSEHAHAGLAADIAIRRYWDASAARASSRLNFDQGRRDGLGRRKYAGIGDPHRSALGADRLLPSQRLKAAALMRLTNRIFR